MNNLNITNMKHGDKIVINLDWSLWIEGYNDKFRIKTRVERYLKN